MRPSIGLRLCVAVTLTAGALAARAAPPASRVDPEYDLSKDEAAKARKAALTGDGAAALKLEMYAQFALHDGEQELLWATIGAEDSSITCEHNLGQLLWLKGAKDDRLRAVYWLKKASAAGDQLSTDMLARIAKGEEP